MTNTNFIDKLFTMHYKCVERLLSAHRFSHFLFPRKKIIHKVFTILAILKNFVLDAANILGPPLSTLQYDRR